MKDNKLDIKHEINTASYYNEQQIIKVWDSYINSKKLHYYCSQTSKPISLFKDQKGIDIEHKAGIIVDETERLYKSNNSLGNTISICGPVDFISNAIMQDGHNAITGDIESALEQIKIWNQTNPESLIDQHTIIFPYHLNALHWCLGQVKLNFKDNVLAKAEIIVIDPMNNGIEARSNVQKEISDVIKKIFTSNVALTSLVQDKYKPQQNDGSSCGVISAENGKDIVDGINNNRIEYTYEPGAEKLRGDHLKDVNNQRFYDMQLKNEAWDNPTFTPPKDLDEIAKAFAVGINKLVKDKKERINEVLKIDDATARAQHIRNFINDNMEVFSEIDINDQNKKINLVERLFINNKGVLGFKDGTIDILFVLTRPYTHKPTPKRATDINPQSFYNEQQILRVWDSYINFNKLHYYCGQDSKPNSLFKDSEGMDIKHKAGILLTEAGKLFKNNNGSGATTSICGPVDYISNSSLLGGHNGITDDIEVALDQIKVWNKTYAGSLICQHTIIFPYHLNRAHWCLGQVKFNFKDNVLAKAEIIIIDPINSGTEVRTNVQKEISDVIKKIFTSNVALTSLVQENYKPQQNDGSSCGVISAENGKDIIDGINNKRIEYIYESGAEELRRNHLKDVNNKRFNEMQLRNEAWGNPTFAPPEDIHRIAKAFNIAIEQLTITKRDTIQESLKTTANPIARAQAIRSFINDNKEAFSEIDIKDGDKKLNLIERLFKDNKGILGFKDDAIDIIILISDNFRKSIKLKPEGLKSGLHGNLYQWSLLTWVTLKANPLKQFQLITEDARFEKFDDLVLKYSDRIIFLQAKHSYQKTGKDNYKESDFTDNDYNGEASLAKYFDSWYRLEKSTHRKKESHYVFCTNRDVDNKNSFLENCTTDIPELNLGGSTLKFKKGDHRKNFIDTIRASSEEIKEYKGTFNLKVEKAEVIEAVNYLGKKLSNDSFKVDGTSQISKKARALIKFSQTDDNALDEICSKMQENDAAFRNWLRAKDVNGKFKINVTKQSNTKPKESDYAKAIEYLLKKFKEKVDAFEINGKTREETRAIIQLAQTDDSVLDKICSKIQKNGTDFKNWLRAKDGKGKFKIAVDIENPEKTLSDVFEIEINNFLDQFILKIEQPNFEQMSEKLKSETSIATPIAAAEYCATIESDILKWFANPLEYELSSEEIKKIIESAKGDALRFYLLADNKETHTLEGTALPDVKNFLVQNQSNIIRIEKTPGIELRVAQSIKEKNIPQDRYAFLSEASSYLEYISTIMKGKQIQVVVFDYSAGDNDISLDISELSKILDAAIKNQKKIILLTKKNDPRFEKYGIKVEINNDLSDAQIEKAVNKVLDKDINLAGKTYKLNALVSDKKSGVYQAMKRPDFLYTILNQDKKKSKVLELGLPYNIYIENQFIQGKPLYKLQDLLRQTDAALFFIKKKPINEIESTLLEIDKNRIEIDNKGDNKDVKYRLIKKQEIFKTSSKEENVKHIFVGDILKQDRKDAYQNSYIILNADGNEITIEEFNNVKLPVANRYNFSNPIQRDKIQDKNFCIVSASAGHGKSSSCLYQREQWVKKGINDQYNWVIRLDLSRIAFQNDIPADNELFNERTTGIEWAEWQLAAINHDMKQVNKVTILLDGFDEIKDLTVISKLGYWMNILPKETQLVINTRPYAAHKIPMPGNRNLDLFLTLSEYTDNERNDYISRYIAAAIGNDSVHTKTVINKYIQIITNSPKNIKSLLGIPLESYLFCSAFEVEIKADFETLRTGGNIAGINNIAFSANDLFEKFLKSKLLLFISKHLQVESRLKLKQDHFLYTSTALYLDILQAFAFKQAFNLDYSIIKDALSDRYLDREIIKDLEDTGLLIAEEKNSEYHLKFNKETYQEYFAALKIISGIMSGNQSVLQIFKQYKHYIPTYQRIFQFAAQISLNGSKFLSRLDINQTNISQQFWGALFGEASKHSDILGVSETYLIRSCLNVLREEDLKELSRISIGKLWRIKLSSLIENYKVSSSGSVVKELEAPVEHQQVEDSTNEFSEVAVAKKIKEYCADKDTLNDLENYIKDFSISDQRKIRKILADELTSKAEWEKESSYWALDFGIRAVGLCGEYFTKELADKLKSRSEMWQNNFENSVNSLNSIYNSVSGSLWEDNIQGIKQKLFYTLSCMFDCKYAQSFTKVSFLNFKNIAKEFFEYLGNESNFKSLIVKALSLAEITGYAVIPSADSKSLYFIGDDKAVISYDDLVFPKVVKALTGMSQGDSKKLIKDVEENAELKKLSQKQIDDNKNMLRQEKLKATLSLLDADKLPVHLKPKFYSFSANKSINDLKEFFQDLQEINFPNTNLAKKVLAETFLSAKHEANSWWCYDFGAPALAYCGRYIDDKIKDYFKTKNDHNKILQSCSTLAEELISETENVLKTNEELTEADQALNRLNDIIIHQDSKHQMIAKIQQTTSHIHSIQGHIKNGQPLENARLLFKMGIIQPIKPDKAASI